MYNSRSFGKWTLHRAPKNSLPLKGSSLTRAQLSTSNGISCLHTDSPVMPGFKNAKAVGEHNRNELFNNFVNAVTQGNLLLKPIYVKTITVVAGFT